MGRSFSLPLMDDVDRILRSPYLTLPAQDALQAAFAKVWGFCGRRFDNLPPTQLDAARARLATLLALVVLASDLSSSTQHGPPIGVQS